MKDVNLNGSFKLMFSDTIFNYVVVHYFSNMIPIYFSLGSYSTQNRGQSFNM